jgi:O-acetyl-ADP-ribose deacetylase (regulator of RNase III)
MNLSNGKVAPVILSKAGPQLQADCTNLGPIQPGEVKGTDGYQMPCKRILHCCLPGWAGPASSQVFLILPFAWRSSVFL